MEINVFGEGVHILYCVLVRYTRTHAQMGRKIGVVQKFTGIQKFGQN